MMVKRDGAFTRAQRISEIRKFLLNLKQPQSLTKSLAVLQFKHGLTKQKVLEYMKIVQDMDGVIIDEERDLISIPTDESNLAAAP